jgi:hypothetical protein
MSDEKKDFVEAVTITVPTSLVKHLTLCSKMMLESTKISPKTDDLVITMIASTFNTIASHYHSQWMKIVEESGVIEE